MTHRQRLEIEASETRQKIRELLDLGELDTEQRAELDTLTKRAQEIEPELRAAIVAEPDPVTSEAPPTADRDRLELRSKVSVGRYLLAAMRGRSVSGAERELLDEAGLDDGSIPLELWDTNPIEERADVVTGAPGTVGVNLDRLRPAIFAPSILPRLGVEMPRVSSGTYASGTITTSLSAAALDKGDPAMATAAAFTVTNATPKRISARLSIAIEDVAAVGQANFESVLRENLSLVLSDALDRQGLNGDGSAPNLQGLVGRLTDPNNPSAVALWADFAGLAADHVDGLWASREEDVALVVNPETYRLACKTFREPAVRGTGGGANADLDTPGDKSAAAYLSERAGAFWTNARMPAAASTIALGIAYRRGRAGIRTAVCPHWNMISIDDIYSGSAKGERYFTMHVLLGDVILVQPDAYARFDLKVAA